MLSQISIVLFFLIHVLKLNKDSVLYPSLDVALFQDLIRLLESTEN